MNTALITGATSGIGETFAKAYGKMGYRLILTGRRMDRLEHLKSNLSTEVLIIAADLSKEDEVFRLISEVENEEISVFINNAGFGTTGRFTETDLKKEIKMIQVNDIAMHILLKEMVKKMNAQGFGSILNVCSSAGLLPAGPYMATYYASKAYITSLTRAVQQELKEMNSPIYLAALCPGPVDTEFNENADAVFSLKGISAEKCVQDAIKGMERHKKIIVPSLTMKLACFFQALVPKNLLIKITGRQQKKKGNY